MTGALHTDPDEARDHGPPPRPSSAASAASAAALHQQQQYAAAAAAAAMTNPFAAAAAMYSMNPAAAAMAAAAASNPLAMMAGGAMNPFMPRFGMVDDAMTTAAAMASWGHMPCNPAAAAAAAAAASGMAGMSGMGLAGLGPNPTAFLNAMAASTPAPPEPIQRPRSTRATNDCTPGFDGAVDAAGVDIKRAPPLHCPVPVVATLAAPTPPMSSPIHARFPSTDPFSQWSSSAPAPPPHYAPSRTRSTAPPADTMPESAQEKERRKTKEAKRRQDVKSRVQRLCTMIGAPVSGAYNASTLDAVIVHMQQLHTTIDELHSMKRILEEQGVDCNSALARARRERNGSASPPKQPPSTNLHGYVSEDPFRSESKRPTSKPRPRQPQPPTTAVSTPQKENIPPTPARPHTPPAYPRVTTAEDMTALLATDHSPPFVAAPTPTPAPAPLPSTTTATPVTMASTPGNSFKARSVLGALKHHPTRAIPGSPAPSRPASRATARAAAAPYPTRPTPSRRASTSVLAKHDTPAATTPSWTPSRLPRQPHEAPVAPPPGRVPLSATKRVSPQSQRAVHEASPSKAVTLEIADDGTPFFTGVAAAAAATSAPMDDLDQMMASVLDPGLRMALLGDMPPRPPAMPPPHGNTLPLDDELSQILEMADAAAATPRTRLISEMSPPASEADAAVRSSPPVLDEQRGEYEHPATDDDLDGEWGANAHGDDEAPGLLELTPFAAELGHSDAPSGAGYGGGDEAAQYQYEEEDVQWTDEAMQFQEFLVDGHDA
ncbi:hypothetical protein GGF31_005918 [Allomyces arbusculus]|nr:hypothetical protein GGF31_005918 [Allomyces arbusculus]